MRLGFLQIPVELCHRGSINAASKFLRFTAELQYMYRPRLSTAGLADVHARARWRRSIRWLCNVVECLLTVRRGRASAWVRVAVEKIQGSTDIQERKGVH